MVSSSIWFSSSLQSLIDLEKLSCGDYTRQFVEVSEAPPKGLCASEVALLPKHYG
jgi:hypothetical protein